MILFLRGEIVKMHPEVFAPPTPPPKKNIFGTPLTAGFEIPTGTFDIILDQFRKNLDLYQIIFGDFFF